MKRKHIYTLAIFTLVIILGACGGKEGGSSTQEANLEQGEELYTKYCSLCHGSDGKKALNGAKDITASPMTLDQRIELIKNGKNLMTPFEGIMSDAEINDVAAYSMTLGK